jgi:WD40 repeat protein
VPAIVWQSAEGRRVESVIRERTIGSCEREWTSPDVEIWDVVMGRQLWELPTQRGWGGYATFSPDGRYLGTGTYPIHLWELASGKLMGTLDTHANVYAFAPDGRTLATVDAYRPSEVALWDLPSQKLRQHLTHDATEIRALAFSNDGRLLATGSASGVVRLWDARTGKETRPRSGLEEPRSVKILPGTRTVAVGTAPGVHFFDLGSVAEADVRCEVRERRLCKLPHLVALASDGRTALAATGRGKGHSLYLWDMDQGVALHRLADALSPVAAFTADNRRVIVGGTWKDALLDVATGNAIWKMPEAMQSGRALAFSADGKLLLTADAPLDSAADVRPPRAADGEFLISVSDREPLQVHIWDTKTGKNITRFPIPADQPDENDRDRNRSRPQLGFSPDQRRIAIVGERRVKLFETTSGKHLLDLNSDGPFAFSPDSRLLATGSRRNSVEVWELISGERCAELRGHVGPIYSLAFTADGKALISSSADNTLLVWDMRLERPGPAAVKLDADLRARCWNLLAGSDAAAAHEALGSLVRQPGETVKFLQPRLPPVALVEAARLRALVAELDATEFEVRDRASTELAYLGVLAGDELRRAVQNPVSLEARRRLERLIAGLPQGELVQPPGDVLRCLRAIRLLEYLDVLAARGILERLASGNPAAVQTREARAALGRRRG